MARTLRQPESNPVTVLAPSGGVTKGMPFVQTGTGRVLVPLDNADAGDPISCYTRGVFRWPKAASMALVQDHWVKWDVSLSKVVLLPTASDDFNLGRVKLAVAADATHVEVVLSDRPRLVKEVHCPIADIAAVSDSSIRRAPFAGRVTRVWSELQGGAINGDAVATAKINTVAITTGVLAITSSASAAGDLDEAVPTALNIVAKNDSLMFSSDGGGSTSRLVDAYMTLEEL